MNAYRLALATLATLVCLATATSASADCRATCSQQYNTCISSCRSTCDNCTLAYNACLGYCQNADSDADGVNDLNDNCPDNYNPDQADCDHDGGGDACDSQDNSWTLIQVGDKKCAVDEGSKPKGKEIRISYADTYRSGCTTASCVKKVGKYTFTCSWFNGDSGDLYHCCRKQRCGLNENEDFVPCPDCDGAWGDHCGTPRCPF
jgi:hypothetical protein